MFAATGMEPKMSDAEPEQLNLENWLREQSGGEVEDLRSVLAQYRDDLMYPPTGEQRERRIKMVKKLLEAK